MSPPDARSLAAPRQAGHDLIQGLQRDVRALQRAQVTVDEDDRLQIGPMYLYATQNADDTVTVYLQNAITGGQPYTLAVLT